MIDRTGPARAATRFAACAALTLAAAASPAEEGFAPSPSSLNDDRLPHRRAPAAELRYERTPMPAVDWVAALFRDIPDDEPTPADLAETVDVRLSPNIAALAESLGGDPTRIFAWVRRNIEYTPSFGSIQGSEGCLLSRKCSAHDTASLLIALFRVSGIPARYVDGRVTLDPALFRSVLGDFEDLDAAARFAALSGTPGTFLLDDAGEIFAVRLDEHVWVEAHLPDAAGQARWVPFEAALKRIRFTPPVDAAMAVGLDRSMYETVLADAMIDAGGNSIMGIDAGRIGALDDMLAAGLDGFLDSLPDDTTVGQITGEAEPMLRRALFDPATLRILPPETPDTNLPNATFEAGERVSELPDSVRHELTLDIVDFAIDIRLNRSLPELADRRLTIGYLPATQADVDLANSSGGLFAAPPDQLMVQPQVYLEGELLEVGDAVPMGRAQRIQLTFTEPSAAANPVEQSVEHFITAGGYAAIGINPGRSGIQGLLARLRRIDATLERFEAGDSVPLDEGLGEILHTQAQIYFALHDAHASLTARELDVAHARRPAEMLMKFEPVFTRDALGMPIETRHGSMTMDFAHNVVAFASRTGNTDDEGSFFFGQGAFSSALEHAIFEITHNAPSVSTLRLIHEANAQGIPIFAIDSRNAAEVLPQLTVPFSTRQDISQFVAGGRYVVVPRDPVSFGLWEGAGYMAVDPVSGAYGFLIDGGISGGSTANVLNYDPHTGLVHVKLPDGVGTAINYTSADGQLVLLRRDAEITENGLRILRGGFRHWRALSPCARARLNTLRRGPMLNGALWSGLFISVPGITGITDLRFHVPSLSAFVFEILAEELREQREEFGLCELDDEEPAP